MAVWRRTLADPLTVVFSFHAHNGSWVSTIMHAVDASNMCERECTCCRRLGIKMPDDEATIVKEKVLLLLSIVYLWWGFLNT